MMPPLPDIEGVAPSRQRLPAGPWKTVLDFLTERFPAVGAAAWVSRMARGQVADEAGRTVTPDSRYRAGGTVYYYREPPPEIPVPFEERIVYRDEHVLVADKPHFLPVIPAGRFLRETLLVRLRRRPGLEDLAPAHRLDRETAGLVLFSVNPATRGAYASLFQERRVRKTYEALARPISSHTFPLTRRSRIVPGEPFFTMKEGEGEANAETRVELLRAGDDVSLYRLIPVTGRKHQLRVHLAALGAPILNDRLYPEVRPEEEEEDYSRPLKLLAKSLAFRDPLDGRERLFESVREL
ncbi:MAG TPA: pseudouridine synthase [Pyrinomonadaceae bacterium]|nr:pseudouridine synthase [Pyrinomonadaceae bacterium]